MPYIVILTYFGLAVFAWGWLLALLAAVPRLRAALPYCWRALLGSVLGFAVANVGSLLVGLVPVGVAWALHIGKDSPGAQVVAGFALLGLFFAPPIVSPLGFLGGAWLGLRRAWSAHHPSHPDHPRQTGALVPAAGGSSSTPAQSSLQTRIASPSRSK